MPEHTPKQPETVSPFAEYALPLQTPLESPSDLGPDMRRIMVRLRKNDITGNQAFTSVMSACKSQLKPQLYFRGITQEGLYEIHTAPADKSEMFIDHWTDCPSTDVSLYRRMMWDTQDQLRYQATIWRRTRRVAAAAIALAAAVPLAIHFGTSPERPVEQSAQAATVPVISKVHHTQKRPNPRRAPSTPAAQTSPDHNDAPATPQQKKPHTQVADPAPQNATSNFPLPVVAGDAFSIVTLNALGASHTDSPRGKDYGKLPKSRERTRLLADFITSNQFDIVGLQEFQRPQRSVLLDTIGNRYDIFPSHPDYHQHASENSIIWDKQQFQLEDSGYRTTYYFNGSEAKMPWVKLRNTATGVSQIILNTHDPADTRQFPSQAKWRAMDQQIHLNDVQKFLKTGLSTYLVGDFNSPACMLRQSGVLTEAIDIATNQSSCPTDSGRIDHVLVPRNAAVAKVLLYRTIRMTDHPKIEVAWVQSAPLS